MEPVANAKQSIGHWEALHQKTCGMQSRNCVQGVSTTHAIRAMLLDQEQGKASMVAKHDFKDGILHHNSLVRFTFMLPGQATIALLHSLKRCGNEFDKPY